jgi:hypothetical protein
LQAARAACETLLRKYRSIDLLLAETTLNWDEFRAAFVAGFRTDSLYNRLSYDEWRAIESWLLSHPMATKVEFAKEFGLTEYYGAQFFWLYSMDENRPEPRRIGGNKLTPEQREHMREMIRDGLGGTEIQSRMKQEYGVTIHRALVTKTRQRMDAKGEL